MPGNQLILEFTGLRSDEGRLNVALFRRAAGFPEDYPKAFRLLILPIVQQHCRAVFEGLEAGRYAYAWYHDRRQLGQLPKNILGQPTEDYGFSNGQRGLFAAPAFGRCLFELNTPVDVHRIVVQRVKLFA